MKQSRLWISQGNSLTRTTKMAIQTFIIYKSFHFIYSSYILQYVDVDMEVDVYVSG